MAARFWVGGTGNWDASTTTHWAATSNGAGGASVPTSADDVTFDANSGTAFTCTVTAAANALSVTFNSASSTLLLNAGLTVVGNMNHAFGIFNTNGQTCSWGSFASQSGSVRTLTFGSSAIAITGPAWSCANIGGLTITANTAVVTITGAALSAATGGANYNGMSFIISGSGGALFGAAGVTTTVANLTRTGTAATSDGLYFTGNVTITGNLVVTGNNVSPNRLLVTSNTITTPRTLTVGGTVTSTNTDWQDITAAGAGDWTLATATGGVGDCGGNSGFGASAFTTPATQTCNNPSTANWSALSWTSRVPLPQDNAVFTGSSSGFITFDVARASRDIDMSGVTSMTLRGGSNLATAWYGSFISGTANSTNSVSGNTWQANGRGTHTLSGAMSPGLSILAGGTYTLASNWTQANGLAVTNSTLNTNGYSLTINSFLNVSGSTGVLNAGTSTITVAAATPTGTFTFGSGACDLSQATLVYGAAASTTSRTFTGGGKTFGALTYTTPNSPGPLVITGANTFGTLTVGPGRTLTLPASTTTTVNNLVTSGVNNGYLRLPGVTGAYASAPDSAAVSITGDQEILIRASIDTLPAVQSYFLSKWQPGLSFRLALGTTGHLLWYDSIDGTTVAYNAILVNATNVNAVITPGVMYWWRVTIDVDNGASKREIKAYWAADNASVPSSWTQFTGGTLATLANGNIADTTSPLEIGSYNAGNGGFLGNVKRVILLNGLSGTTAFDADFTTKPFGANSFTESSANAATVTLNGLAQQGDGRLEINSSTPGQPAQLALPNGSV